MKRRLIPKINAYPSSPARPMERIGHIREHFGDAKRGGSRNHCGCNDPGVKNGTGRR
jgi:hypothetical protein